MAFPPPPPPINKQLLICHPKANKARYSGICFPLKSAAISYLFLSMSQTEIRWQNVFCWNKAILIPHFRLSGAQQTERAFVQLPILMFGALTFDSYLNSLSYLSEFFIHSSIFFKFIMSYPLRGTIVSQFTSLLIITYFKRILLSGLVFSVLYLVIFRVPHPSGMQLRISFSWMR